jgi:hypothetical protein
VGIKRPRFLLRTLMTAIAFLALVLTVAVQYVQFRRRAARVQRFRYALARAQFQAEWASAVMQWQRFTAHAETVEKQWAASWSKQMDHHGWVRKTARTQAAASQQSAKSDRGTRAAATE